jgi:hypothetical protein
MMRRFALLSAGVLFVACAKSETPATDTGMAMAPAPAPAPVPAPVSMSSIAGKYKVTGKNEAGDSTLLTYDLDATDSTKWTIKFTDRTEPVAQRLVSVSGDSIVLEAGPYKSALRKGVMVTTRTVYHVQDGKLMGRTVAHYNTKGPDTVRVVISEGIKQ